jgi:hypothetical protein
MRFFGPVAVRRFVKFNSGSKNKSDLRINIQESGRSLDSADLTFFGALGAIRNFAVEGMPYLSKTYVFKIRFKVFDQQGLEHLALWQSLLAHLDPHT